MLNFNKISVSKYFNILLIILLGIISVNCSDDESIISDSELYSSEESAEAIASNIATETGGSTDQMQYLSDLASEDGIENIINSSISLAKTNNENIVSVDTLYDEVEGKWTITITRERTIEQRNLTSNFYHVFNVQYLKDGVPQKYFLVGESTANKINFDIIEGSGNVQSNRIKHSLNGVNGSWTATIANNILSVNGSYNRSAEDEYSGENFQRNFNYSLELNFSGVSIPQNNGDEITVYMVGTMSGQFIANYNATKNGENISKSINQNFSLKFSANKTFEIEVEDETYKADLETGEIE